MLGTKAECRKSCLQGLSRKQPAIGPDETTKIKVFRSRDVAAPERPIRGRAKVLFSSSRIEDPGFGETTRAIGRLVVYPEAFLHHYLPSRRLSGLRRFFLNRALGTDPRSHPAVQNIDLGMAQVLERPPNARLFPPSVAECPVDKHGTPSLYAELSKGGLKVRQFIEATGPTPSVPEIFPVDRPGSRQKGGFRVGSASIEDQGLPLNERGGVLVTHKYWVCGGLTPNNEQAQ